MDVLPDRPTRRTRPTTVQALLALAVLQAPVGLLVLFTELDLGGFSVDLPWVGLTVAVALLVRAGRRAAAAAVAWWVLVMAVLTVPLWLLGLFHLPQAIAVVWLVRRP